MHLFNYSLILEVLYCSPVFWRCQGCVYLLFTFVSPFSISGAYLTDGARPHNQINRVVEVCVWVWVCVHERICAFRLINVTVANPVK